jgi:hypothetical protein
MLRLTIVCGTLAVALPFLISMVASPLGTAVSERFLERPGKLPAEVSDQEDLTASILRAWVTQEATAKHAKGYARRVMPLDMLYLVFLGLFLGLAAVLMAGFVKWPPNFHTVPLWFWWIAPVVYIACDFCEDSLIIGLLTWPSGITDTSLDVLSCLKWTKIGSVSLAMVQVLLLGLLTCIWA